MNEAKDIDKAIDQLIGAAWDRKTVMPLADIIADAKRYRYMKEHMEWRRSGTLADDDSHAFVGCRFSYLDNFECQSMLDFNIDRRIEAERNI